MSLRKASNSSIEPQMITCADGLNTICTKIQDSKLFAFDTEFVKEDRFEAEICLAQVALSSEDIYIIDPLIENLDITPLWELVSNPEVLTIVHAGMEDFTLCARAIDLPPKNIFDVQTAAGLIGIDYPISLSRLVNQMLDISLRKSQTLTDWSRRPLREIQIQYAADDVAFLPEIHKRISKRLEKHERHGWAREEFSKMEEFERYATPANGDLSKIKGTRSLNARSRAILLELAKERTRLAETLNRPERAVLRDHIMVELARHGWTEPNDIRNLRGIHLNRRALADIADAVVRGKSMPVSNLPQIRTIQEESPEEAVIISIVQAVIRAFCLENHLSYSLVTNKEDIRTTVLSCLRKDRAIPSPLMQGWRGKALGETISNLLEGRSVLRLVHQRPCPSLQVEQSDDQEKQE